MCEHGEGYDLVSLQVFVCVQIKASEQVLNKMSFIIISG